MPENLMIPNVKDWLEKQGFLLEMKTAAAVSTWILIVARVEKSTS